MRSELRMEKNKSRKKDETGEGRQKKPTKGGWPKGDLTSSSL